MKTIKNFSKFNEELDLKNVIKGAALGAGLALSNPSMANDVPKDSIEINNEVPNKILNFTLDLDRKYGNSLYGVERPISFLENEMNEFDASLRLKTTVEFIKNNQPNFPLNINIFYVYTDREVPIITLDYKVSDKIHFTLTKNDAWDRNLVGLSYNF